MSSSSNHSNGPLSSGQARTSSRSGSRLIGSSSVRAGREAGVRGNELLDLGDMGRTTLGGPRFHVEAEERFGIGRADVVPPFPVVDREPIEPVDRGAGLALVRGD